MKQRWTGGRHGRGHCEQLLNLANGVWEFCVLIL